MFLCWYDLVTLLLLTSYEGVTLFSASAAFAHGLTVFTVRKARWACLHFLLRNVKNACAKGSTFETGGSYACDFRGREKSLPLNSAALSKVHRRVLSATDYVVCGHRRDQK